MARPRNNRHRNRSNYTNDYLLFASSTTLGWRVTRRISFVEGEAKVARGHWRRVVDDVGKHIGYQPIESKLPSKPSDRFSPAALGEREAKANAGLYGASRTEGLSDEKRATRVHPRSGRLMPEEDFIERVRGLMAIYPKSANRGGDRAVRVYPKAPPQPQQQVHA